MGDAPCGDDAAKDLHQRIIEASFLAEIFLKRLIYQPLHLHTAQFQVFMPACKLWGTIRGGVWMSAEVSGGAPLEVSGGGRLRVPTVCSFPAAVVPRTLGEAVVPSPTLGVVVPWFPPVSPFLAVNTSTRPKWGKRANYHTQLCL